MVNADESLVVHHARDERDTIVTKFVRQGTLRLDPPGIALDLDEVFGRAT